MNSDASTFESFCNLYQIKIQEENTSLEKKYVTTEHIQIVSKKDGTPINKEETRKYFPKDPITQDYILLCVLYPNFNASQSENEAIELTANFNIGTAEESSCWNVVAMRLPFLRRRDSSWPKRPRPAQSCVIWMAIN